MKLVIEDTPEQAAFRRQFREWLASVLPAGWIESIQRGDEEGFAAARKNWDPLSWMRTIGESGYAAPLWPKEYGGLSGEPWMQSIIREELAAHRLPLAGINLLGIGLAGPTIIAHGTEEQKRRYLRPILTGEEIWCQLFSEPGAGSDLASVATRAERDGDEWVINGQKVWTTLAQLARFGMLLARSDPDVPKHQGLTYFIVDMKAPGVEVRPLRQMTGGAEFNEVFLTNLRVPDANRVGGVGEGWLVARTTLMNERIALSGISMDPATFLGGSAKKDPWAIYLSSFPSTSDRLVRDQLMRIYVERELKEVTSFRANLRRRRGETPGAEGGFLKVFNAEHNQRASVLAVNANGMRATAWDPGDKEAEQLAYRFLRARANTIEGGTSEVLRNQIGERILGLPREPEVDRDIPWSEIRKNAGGRGAQR
jgi:alkylation response protein AidB-like acyl-CoA dehydrogenase